MEVSDGRIAPITMAHNDEDKENLISSNVVAAKLRYSKEYILLHSHPKTFEYS